MADAVLLKIVSFHDFPLRAAWACHWLLGWLKQHYWENMEGDNFEIIMRRINVSTCNVVLLISHKFSVYYILY